MLIVEYFLPCQTLTLRHSSVNRDWDANAIVVRDRIGDVRSTNRSDDVVVGGRRSRMAGQYP